MSAPIMAKKHHVRGEDCTTRARYRQGRDLRAVKVYSISQESRYLLVQGVPALGTKQELVKMFALYGTIEEYRLLDEYPSDDFTEVFWIKFQRIQSARMAKKKTDDQSFFGGILHVCYAPEFEMVDDTRLKLQERRKVMARKLREIEKEESGTTVSKSEELSQAQRTDRIQESSRRLNTHQIHAEESLTDRTVGISQTASASGLPPSLPPPPLSHPPPPMTLPPPPFSLPHPPVHRPPSPLHHPPPPLHYPPWRSHQQYPPQNYNLDSSTFPKQQTSSTRNPGGSANNDQSDQYMERQSMDRVHRQNDSSSAPVYTHTEEGMVDKGYKPTNRGAIKMFPRQLQRKKNHPLLLAVNHSKTDKEEKNSLILEASLNSELKKNAYIIGDMTGPSIPKEKQDKLKDFRTSVTSDKSLDNTSQEIRKRVLEFSSKVIPTQILKKRKKS